MDNTKITDKGNTPQSIWAWYICSAFPTDTNDATMAKVNFVNVFSLIGFSCLVIFSLVHFFTGSGFAGTIELAIALFTACNLIMLRLYKRLEASVTILLLLLYVILQFLMLNGGLYNTGIFWYFTFPALAFFLAGKRKGLWWLVLVFFTIFIVILLSVTGFIAIPYTYSTLQQFIASFLTVTLLIFFYESVNETDTALIARHDTDLAAVNTTLKKEKTALAEEELRDEAIIGGIGEGMIATNHEGYVTRMNTVASEMLGITLEEMKGKKWETDFPYVVDEANKAIPNEHRAVPMVLQSGMKSASVYWYERKDGSKLPISVTAAPLIHEGTMKGVVIIFRDITKERSVDNMKTEFVSLVSHQLRTPLAAVQGFADVLLHEDIGQLSPQQAEYIQNIATATADMHTLVTSLLDVSRVEAGKLTMDLKPTYLRGILEDSLLQITKIVAEKQIQIITNIDEHIDKVMIDGELIRQVYTNLLLNSVKYTPSGGQVTVTIKKQGDEIISEIKDTGYGIPSEIKEKVFQKFYRGSNIVKYVPDGNGLGLYMAKEIVEATGGTIWFTSTENEGSVFSFNLPLKETAQG